jgi:valyl-tRNA synthetase
MVEQIEKKLANEDFLKRAPVEVVDKERRKKENFLETLARLDKNLAQISG